MQGFVSNFNELDESGMPGGHLSGILATAVKVRGKRGAARPAPLDTAADAFRPNC
ncbi:hypothetical protein EFR01_29300 [Sinorhizobium fredii]|nr:hypothetical protein EFR01_29300 [Sinorhizobium fredii]GLS10642.1 hypothetical protein GCM10007864_42730 [Sinorhizobium fredii]